MPNKKRVFISMHYLELGGAETSLIGLLQALDPERVEVDLFLYDHRGEMMRHVPGWVQVLPRVEEYAMVERPLLEVLRRGHLLIAAARILARIAHTIYKWRRHPTDGSAIFGYVGKYVTPLLPRLKGLGTYDLAVSYLTPHNPVPRMVSARKRACWIHTDYKNIDVNAALELPVWQAYDTIVSISPSVTDAFLSVFPTLSSKIVEMENLLPAAIIREQATAEPLAGMERHGGETVLLTIGRYSYAKHLDAIPLLCRLLREGGLDVSWYIIGYGGSDDYIREAVQRHNVQGFVHLLGKRANPYPYLLACDWYVQPSRYEGKSVTVREAQLLGKPVIVSAYPTAASQITHGEDGLILPMDLRTFAEELALALRDEPLRQRIIGNLSRRDYSGRCELDTFYKMIP